MSAGPNKLIQQGATPVLSATDVLEIIAPHILTGQSQLALGANELESQILSLLGQGMRDGDELQRTCDVDTSEFNIALTMLEINGAIRSLGANQWTLR